MFDRTGTKTDSKKTNCTQGCKRGSCRDPWLPMPLRDMVYRRKKLFFPLKYIIIIIIIAAAATISNFFLYRKKPNELITKFRYSIFYEELCTMDYFHSSFTLYNFSTLFLKNKIRVFSLTLVYSFSFPNSFILFLFMLFFKKIKMKIICIFWHWAFLFLSQPEKKTEYSIYFSFF